MTFEHSFIKFGVNLRSDELQTRIGYVGHNRVARAYNDRDQERPANNIEFKDSNKIDSKHTAIDGFKIGSSISLHAGLD